MYMAIVIAIMMARLLPAMAIAIGMNEAASMISVMPLIVLMDPPRLTARLSSRSPLQSSRSLLTNRWGLLAVLLTITRLRWRGRHQQSYCHYQR
jgi:hypothetical protein